MYLYPCNTILQRDTSKFSKHQCYARMQTFGQLTYCRYKNKIRFITLPMAKWQTLINFRSVTLIARYQCQCSHLRPFQQLQTRQNRSKQKQPQVLDNWFLSIVKLAAHDVHATLLSTRQRLNRNPETETPKTT